MGEVDEKISMPRKEKPEPVAAGSVGIAGKQTGISHELTGRMADHRKNPTKNF